MKCYTVLADFVFPRETFVSHKIQQYFFDGGTEYTSLALGGTRVGAHNFILLLYSEKSLTQEKLEKDIHKKLAGQTLNSIRILDFLDGKKVLALRRRVSPNSFSIEKKVAFR